MHDLTQSQWHEFFVVAARILGRGDQGKPLCAFTTFARLRVDAGYWTLGLPTSDDLEPTHIKDGGVWGQPFAFDELAHMIVPKSFVAERYEGESWKEAVAQTQAIGRLSEALTAAAVPHRLTDLVLEIKRY